MEAETEREIIRLWHRLRRLEREGCPSLAARRQVEKALEDAAIQDDLAKREDHAA